MQVRTVNRLYDDNGKECDVGDSVMLQTKNMDEPVPAVIKEILTSMVAFDIDDLAMGFVNIKTRVSDVEVCTLKAKAK